MMDMDFADAKATKSDDAAVDVERWNLEACRASGLPPNSITRRAFGSLRRSMLRWYKRRCTKKFFKWLGQKFVSVSCGGALVKLVRPQGTVGSALQTSSSPTYQWMEQGSSYYRDWWIGRSAHHGPDLLAGHDAIRRIADSTWWEWDAGSWCAHWKWPFWYQGVIRDGLPVRFWYTPDRWRRPQRRANTQEMHEASIKKLQKVHLKDIKLPFQRGLQMEKIK